MNNILVAGSVTIDEIEQGHHIKKHIMGGVVSYAGLTYRSHGFDVNVATSFSEEDECISTNLYQQGVHVNYLPSPKTTRFANLNEGSRRYQRLLDHARPIVQDQIFRDEGSVSLFHMGPLHPLDIEAAVYAKLPELSVPVALDLQGVVRIVAEDGEISLGRTVMTEPALKAATHLKASRGELNCLLLDPQRSIADFVTEYGIKELIVTDGCEGGEVFVAGRSIRFKAHPVSRVADRTGAGDVFFSSYLVHHLFHNRSVLCACNEAAKAASLHIQDRRIEKALGLDAS